MSGLGWYDVRVVAHSGTTMALSEDKDGRLIIVVQNEAGYWPQGVKPIESTIQTIPLGHNTFHVKKNIAELN